MADPFSASIVGSMLLPSLIGGAGAGVMSLLSQAGGGGGGNPTAPGAANSNAVRQGTSPGSKPSGKPGQSFLSAASLIPKALNAPQLSAVPQPGKTLLGQ